MHSGQHRPVSSSASEPQSATMLAGRAGIGVAERLGTAPVTFPGGHDGFVGGEYGGMGEPDAFAATLREVLAG